MKKVFGRPMPHYIPCRGNDGGKHKFERLKHNAFEKCMLCGEPRFALVDLSYPGSPLCRFLDKVLS